MTGSVAATPGAGASLLANTPLLICVSVALGLAPSVIVRIIPGAFARSASCIGGTIAMAACVLAILPEAGSPLLLAAIFASGVSVSWALCAAYVRRFSREPSTRADLDDRVHLSSVAQRCALTSGAVAASVVLFLLATRVVLCVWDVINGSAGVGSQPIGASMGGLVVLGLLLIACVLELVTSGDGRLVTAVFWLLAIAGVWIALLNGFYRAEPNGEVARTAWSITLALCWSVVLWGFTVTFHALRVRRRWKALWSDPSRLTAASVVWPGFRRSAGILGLLLILVACQQLAVPAQTAGADWWWTGAVGVGVLGSGVMVLSLLKERWGPHVGDAGMGLVTLGVVLCCLLTVPGEPIELGRRYPMVFNAAMIGFALMCGFWIWLGRVWRQQLDAGRPWTATGWLALSSERFSFYVACVSLVTGSVMAIWPRLRPVADADDSLGRFAAGVGGHLLLLAAVTWGRRVVKRSSFSILAILVIVSLAAFVVIRSLPWMSSVA